MYRIYFTNFGWYANDSFETLEGAVKGAMAAGFESMIYKGQMRVASYSPLYGLQQHMAEFV